MKITEITDEHLLNRIRYFERMLFEKPQEQVYIGDSEYAESAVEQENRFNDDMEDKIRSHVAYMKKEAKNRKLSLLIVSGLGNI